MVPENFNTSIDSNGDLVIHPEGDRSVPASAKMPKASYFFDAITRQETIVDSNLNSEDNLEVFTLFSDEDQSILRIFSRGFI